MKKENKDIVIKVQTEWDEYNVSVNFDTDCHDMIRHYCNMLRGMTFTTYSIVKSLREVADDIEYDMKLCNKYNDNNCVDYGTADKEGTDHY